MLAGDGGVGRKLALAIIVQNMTSRSLVRLTPSLGTQYMTPILVKGMDHLRDGNCRPISGNN
jgi:hypothetical protein